MIIRINHLLESANIKQLNSQGMAYKLWRTNPLDNNQEIIAVNAPEYLRDPVHKVFDVPNGAWTLSIAPISGWINWWRLSSEIMLALALSGLLGYQTF